jgi:hypothetical protein
MYLTTMDSLVEMWLPYDITTVGDEISLETNKQYLICFTEIEPNVFYVQQKEINI